MKIHGTEYTDTKGIRNRITELRNENARLGESDGRVTELVMLQDVLDAAPVERPTKPAPRKPSAETLRRSRREICSVHYTDEKGYKKRRGFASYDGLDGFLEKAESRGYCVIAYA